MPPPGARRTLPCSTCTGPVDPLRASRVAIFRERFRYFCSADCRERYDPERSGRRCRFRAGERRGRYPRIDRGSRLLRPASSGAALAHVGSDVVALRALDARAERSRPARTPGAGDLATAPKRSTPKRAVSPGTTSSTPPDVGAVLLVLAMVGGGACRAAGAGRAIFGRAVPRAPHDCGARRMRRAGRRIRDGPARSREPHPVALLAAPVVATWRPPSSHAVMRRPAIELRDQRSPDW